jgi:hypothetical protein
MLWLCLPPVFAQGPGSVTRTVKEEVARATQHYCSWKRISDGMWETPWSKACQDEILAYYDKKKVGEGRTTGQSVQPASPGCDPNWSSQWDQLERQYQERLRQPGIVDQAIQGSGGLQTLLAAEKTETEGSDLEALERTKNAGVVPPGWTPEQYLAFRQGLLDVAHCRAGVSRSNATAFVAGGGNQSSQPGKLQTAASPQSPAQIDVRYLPVDSRPLSDAEMRDLRNSLRWEPDSAALTPGGTARSNLVDDKGRRLGSVLVRWDKTTTPKATQSRSPGQNRGYFTVQVENGTSCVFQSSAELDDTQGFIAVGGVTWSGWLTLHQPERGQTSQARGDAALTQAYPSLVLKPLTAYSTLSACMTPKNP